METTPVKKKFNIIDIITVVLIVALIGGTVWRFASPSANFNSGTKKVTYTLKVLGVRPFTAQYYKEGLKCFDMYTDEWIGVIKSVRVEEFLQSHVARTGEQYKVRRPNMVVIYVTIEADGRETPEAVYAGGSFKLRIGAEVKLQTKYIDVNTTVEAIGENSFVKEGNLYNFDE